MFSVKSQMVNILGLGGHIVSVTTAKLCCHSAKETETMCKKNEHICIPMQLYVWMLKYESHIIFTCYEIVFFSFFSMII